MTDLIPVAALIRRAARFDDEFGPALDGIRRRGVFLAGPELDAFEVEFAGSTGYKRCVGVGSGTSALTLTMTAMGIGAEDEVIVPAFTAVATVAAVCATGAVPVMADVDEDTGCLTHEHVRPRLTRRTRAVIIVHLYGRPTPVPELDCPVIEDASHAHGAVPPSSSAAACYSFYPTKNLGAFGDAGAVVTNDLELAERIASMRIHGRGPDGRHRYIATNSRLSEINAAILRIGLRHLDEDNRRRREIAGRYRQAAQGLEWQSPHPDHAYHLCVVRVRDREAFRKRLYDRGVETAVHYPYSVPDEPAYARFARDDYPKARRWAAQCVTLPCFPEQTDGEVDYVCRALS